MKITENKRYSLTLTKEESDGLLNAAKILESMDRKITELEEVLEADLSILCTIDQMKNIFSSVKIRELTKILTVLAEPIELY